MTISVLIATYGAEKWQRLAQDRALPSAQREKPDEIVVYHDAGGTVGSSRNEAARRATSDWLLFLDGDDELAPGFVAAMQSVVEHTGEFMDAGRVLFTPRVSYVNGRHTRPPKFWPEVPLSRGNWLVIGTLIHRDLFWKVGGFKDYGDPLGSNAYEDFALWSRCVKAGATIVKVPEAVYIAHVDFASRHRHATPALKRAWHTEIGEDVWPEHYGPDATEPLRLRRVR